MAGLDQAEGRSQKLHLGLPGSQDLRHVVLFFPGHYPGAGLEAEQLGQELELIADAGSQAVALLATPYHPPQFHLFSHKTASQNCHQ